MQIIGTAAAVSSRPPREFFDRWCDLGSHGEWAASMEWLRLDAPFRDQPIAVGATGVSRTSGGDERPFRVTEVEDGRAYADATVLDGAELTVRHLAEPDGAGSSLTLTASVNGPEEEEWAFTFGDLSAALQADLDALVALLES